ncbi:DUF4365 domain-containing protein [Saccharothrix sp.]|uniref:DUF4365 domain-containing protein n=1 Tax=Saccharothrix sp. TaxID=1873460 RepID=UPI0028127066|nr:DUF4365 domain-containing protein [Saccharothrix sp.]
MVYDDDTGASVPRIRDGGLTPSARQEQFSLGFLRMIAAAAGCSVNEHATDYDGVDVTIAASADYLTWYCPSIDVQLKCTTQHRLLRDDHLAWPMERDPFLKLINPKRFNGALLGVLLVPENHDGWLDLSDEGLVSASRMYWEHSSKLGSIEEGRASKTVHLPRSNLFDVESLKGIMQRIGDGEGGSW